VTEPQKVLVDAATDALRDAARDLRRRGWPVELLVEHVAVRDTFAVSLRFELPHIPTPIEAVEATEALAG
jgi:hypothetical protein